MSYKIVRLTLAVLLGALFVAPAFPQDQPLDPKAQKKLEDAEKFLQGMIKDIVALVASTSPASSAPAFQIVKRDYPPQQQIGLKPLILVNGQMSNVAVVGDTLTAVDSPK